jgi:excisionase family DNA binding protein
VESATGMNTLTSLVAERRDLTKRLADIEAAIVLELAALRQSAIPQDLIDAKTAARRLGISTVYLYELSRLKKIPATRIGRAVRYRPEDITNYSNRRNT